MEAVWWPSKFSLEVPCDSFNPSPGICPREMKAYVHTKHYPWMLLSAFFIIPIGGNNSNVHLVMSG